jgi:hypothetical protein
MHVREHRSVTAAMEKRLLVWIAARLRLFDVGGVVAVTGLTFVFLNRAVRRTRALAAAERVRPGHAA